MIAPKARDTEQECKDRKAADLIANALALAPWVIINLLRFKSLSELRLLEAMALSGTPDERREAQRQLGEPVEPKKKKNDEEEDSTPWFAAGVAAATFAFAGAITGFIVRSWAALVLMPTLVIEAAHHGVNRMALRTMTAEQFLADLGRLVVMPIRSQHQPVAEMLPEPTPQ